MTDLDLLHKIQNNDARITQLEYKCIPLSQKFSEKSIFPDLSLSQKAIKTITTFIFERKRYLLVV